MPGYRFRITVETLTDRKGEPVEKPERVFDVGDTAMLWHKAITNTGLGEQMSGLCRVGL